MKKIIFIILFFIVSFGIVKSQEISGGSYFILDSIGNSVNPANKENQELGNGFLESIDDKDFSTSAKQDSGNNILVDIKAFFTNIYNQTTNWLAVKVINIPSDYSTSAKQDTTNSKLDDIKANQTNETQKTQIIDSDGNNFVTEDNILRIHDTPHSAPELSVHMTQETATQSTLSVQANKGSRDIVLVSATGFAVNNRIKIIDGANGENDILKVLAVNGNTLTLDRVLDADQTAGRVVKKVLINMNVDGSVTEQVFSYKPRTGENKRITGINISIVSATEPSTEKFGGITALTRGVHFRVKNATGRDQTYFISFRSNIAFELSDFDYIKETKVGGGEYTTFLKSNFFQKMRSVVPLNDTQEFQIIIQDNLTTLSSFEVKLSMYDESGVIY